MLFEDPVLFMGICYFADDGKFMLEECDKKNQMNFFSKLKNALVISERFKNKIAT